MKTLAKAANDPRKHRLKAYATIPFCRGTAFRLCTRALLAALLAAAPACRRSEPVDRQKIVEAAQNMVVKQLASPGTVGFGGEADTTVEELGGRRYRVTGLVDYEGETGSMRNSFTCVLRCRSAQGCELEELTFQ